MSTPITDASISHGNANYFHIHDFGNRTTFPLTDIASVTNGSAPLDVFFNLTDDDYGNYYEYSAPNKPLYLDDSWGSLFSVHPSAFDLLFDSPGVYTVIINGTHVYGIESPGNPSIGLSTLYLAYYFNYVGTITVTAPSKPVANFTSNVTNGTAPLTVQFKDASKGSSTSWFWNFGDKNISTAQNPVHTYYKSGNYTVSLKVTNTAGNNTTIKVNDINVTNKSNIFYPGINWQKGDKSYNLEATELNAKMVNSYLGTHMDDGAFQVFLASKTPPIGTKTNFLADSSDSGMYNVAFAHSGGTRTLVDKIESGKVKANYIVLAAPALITQTELQGLTKYGVKKVVVFQCSGDILNLLNVTLERNHQFKIQGYPSTVAPAMTIHLNELPLNVMLGHSEWSQQSCINFCLNHRITAQNLINGYCMLNYGFLWTMDLEINGNNVNGVIDLTRYLKQANLNSNVIPESQTFWIGGADRNVARLFVNSGNVIVVTVPYTKNVDPVTIHKQVGLAMAYDYANSLKPFDGKNIPGLKGSK